MTTADEKTILFVDDEENILRSLRRLFHREGYKILLAKGAQQGLNLLDQHEVDLVISDVRMPEMNGVEFLSRVRKRHPDTACMVLSGYAEKEAVTRIFSEINVQEMIAKPWDDDELKQTVRDLLEKSSSPKEFSPGLHNLINSFEALPPLPQTYQAVQQALNEAREKSADVVADAINQNPPLATRLLQVSNSTFFGQRRSVETISRAIFVLGLDFVQNLVLATGAFQQLANNKSANFNNDQLWQHSLSCGFVARHIARIQNGDRSMQETALFAGTMHDLGKLILARFAATRYDEVQDKLSQGKDICAVEREVLGTDHAEIGGYAAELWNLPPRICEAVRYHHQPTNASIDKKLACLIHLANALSHHLEQDEETTETLPISSPKVYSILDLTSSDVERIAQQVRSLHTASH